jgi:hypothetical protein
MWFYRPGCPHCDNMKNEWITLMSSISPNNITFKSIDVSLPENKKIVTDYAVYGVPRIIKHSSRGIDIYNGARTASAMKAWLMRDRIYAFESARNLYS